MPRHSMAVALLLSAALGIGAAAAPARAERVHDLSHALLWGKTEKARISAAVSLGRLRDPRALKPLIRALSDDSNIVRALAATGLGMLGDEAAVPALQRASQDPDGTVRRRAGDAIEDIKRLKSANTPPESGRAQAMAAPPFARRNDRLANYSIVPHEQRATFGPRVYVIVKSAQDKTNGQAAVNVRQMRATEMRSMVVDELKRDTQVTLLSSSVNDLPFEPYAVDVAIMKMERVETGPYVEIACEIRVAISTQRGKMLSFLTGGARVQVPKRTFRVQYEPQLRREALENAVKSVHQDLVSYLRSRPS